MITTIISIRGHDESDESKNKGNFHELLHLRAKDNKLLEDSIAGNQIGYRYVSGTHSNELLSIMAKQVQRNIVNDIKKAKLFSILIDETQDLSRHEQVSFIVWYVDDMFQPHEVFLGFYKTNKTDSETLTNLIKEVLSKNDLKIENIRGQCYDGAAAMRGSYTGVQARIRQENQTALYVHCYAHILNLCLVDLTKQVSFVRNMFGAMQSLHNFIHASSKRHAVFESTLLEFSKKSGPSTLKSLSDTRWSCRAEALNSILLNYEVIIKTLEEISETDISCGPEATSLLKNICDFEFVFCLVFLKDVMTHTNILSKYLQSINMNYAAVISMSTQTINIFKEMRSDKKFDEMWDKVIEMAIENNIEPAQLPRKKKYQ